MTHVNNKNMDKNQSNETPTTGPRSSLPTGSPLWRDRSKTPCRKGWYITRTPDGYLSWRAWGKGAWWKQIKGGWIESFDGAGNAARYDWQPQSWKSMDLDAYELPDLAKIKAAMGEPSPLTAPDMESENVSGCELMMGCRLVCLHHAPLLAEPCRRCPRQPNAPMMDGERRPRPIINVEV